MLRGRQSAGRQERGAAAVEFALVVPLLLLLVFGIISFGYMLSFRQAISQGAAEGARAAAITALPAASDKVRLAVGALNESLGSYQVRCTISGTATSGDLIHDNARAGTCAVAQAKCANNTTLDCVSVQVTYEYADHALVPTLPGVGLVMPRELSYTAVAQVG